MLGRDNNQWGTESDIGFLHRPGPLFQKYQRKVFGEIKRIRGQPESPLKRITLIMADNYCSWIKDLEKEESEDCAMTVAMLKLHQVPGALSA